MCFIILELQETVLMQHLQFLIKRLKLGLHLLKQKIYGQSKNTPNYPKNFAFFTLTKADKTLIKRPKNLKNYFFIFLAPI